VTSLGVTLMSPGMVLVVKKISIKNGMRQGGIISHILFCIYIDGFLCMLRESGAGCFIGNVFWVHWPILTTSRRLASADA